MTILPTIALFVALLALTAFFNFAEMALVAARTAAIEAEPDGGARRRTLALKGRPGLFLAAIRTGSLVTDMLIGALVVTRFAGIASDMLGEGFAVMAGIGVFVGVSYLNLVFADLVPKSVALGAPERAALRIAAPLSVLIFLSRPLLAILEGSNHLVLRILGVKERSEGEVTQEEIRLILAQGLSAGVLQSFERSMMERVLDLNDRIVRTIMTPRTEMQVIDVALTREALRQALLAATSSRLIVAEGGNLDRMVGVISRVAVFAALARDEVVDLRALSASPAFVAENASVLSLLQTMKTVRLHMAMVVDEFGAIIGLVTLADIMGAVAGDFVGFGGPPLKNQLDALMQQADGSYLVSAREPVHDYEELLVLKAPAGRHYQTLGGLVLDRLRRIPAEGDGIDLPGLRIEVAAVDRGLIRTLRLIRT